MKKRYIPTFFSTTGLIDRKGWGGILPALLLVLFLAGCASSQAPGEKSGLREFVRADITSALLSAIANKDRLAAMCWQALLEHMGNQPTTEKSRTAGVLSAYQRVRNFRRRPRGIDEDVRIGCAPMVSEGRARIFRKIRRLATGL